jgi:hypothetical protein
LDLGKPLLESLNIFKIFGMRNIKSFLMALLSIYQSCYAHDLGLNSYVVSLAYESLCSIIHAIYLFGLDLYSNGGSLYLWVLPCPMLVD